VKIEIKEPRQDETNNSNISLSWIGLTVPATIEFCRIDAQQGVSFVLIHCIEIQLHLLNRNWVAADAIRIEFAWRSWFFFF